MIVVDFRVSADRVRRINGLTTSTSKPNACSGSVTALLIDTVKSGIGYTTVGRNAETTASTIETVATATATAAAVTKAAAAESDAAVAVIKAATEITEVAARTIVVAMTIAVVIGGTYIKRRRWPTGIYRPLAVLSSSKTSSVVEQMSQPISHLTLLQPVNSSPSLTL